MTSENPFVYGEIVTAGAFADREGERARLSRDLAAGQKVFLISPRRYGKSSLIRDVMRGLARQRILTIEVTVAASSSYIGFLESYARALVSADTPAARLRRWATELLQGITPELRFDATGAGDARFSLAFPNVRTSREVARLAAEVFALPGRIAAARNRRLAIALDEFQTIASFDGGSVEQALRAAVQEQRQVGYVFAGSEPSLMERMLGPRRPFYKAGPVLRLEKIDEDAFARFLDARFAKSGIVVEPGLGHAIIELAGNVPYDVQRLAHETWDDVRTRWTTDGWTGRPASHAVAASWRAKHHLRGVVAAAHASTTRGPARPGAGAWPGAALGRCPGALPLTGRLQRPVRIGCTRKTGRRVERRERLRGERLPLP